MYNSLSIEERVNFYLAPKLRSSTVVKQNLPSSKYKNFYFDKSFLWGQHGQSTFNRYVQTAVERFSELNINSSHNPIILGDVSDAGEKFLFSKSRLEDPNGTYTLIKCLDEARHWESINSTDLLSSVGMGRSANQEILRYSDKKSAAVFIGATSGGCFGWNLRSGNRLCLVEKYGASNNPKINVGFSVFGQEAEDFYSRYRKPALAISQQREYKYIISVEGNDKDSGLQWKLKSNSVVFMPRPKISSWLMETTLIPNYHYIELRDDFEDLEEKINWCDNNYKKCIEIIINAHNYMSQFEDLQREREIEKKVIEKHLSLVYYT